MPQQPDHFQSRFSAFNPFVPDVATRPVDGLFHGVASKHTEQYGQIQIQSYLTQAEAHLAVDMLVVGRFTSNDGPQAEDRLKFAGAGQMAGNERNFPRPRNPGDRYITVRNACLNQRLRRPSQQLSGDIVVVFGNDNGVLAIGWAAVAAKDLGHEGNSIKLIANKGPLEGVLDAGQFRLRGALADVNSDSSTVLRVVID